MAPNLQVIRPDLLRQGFKLVVEKGLEVTDDVSLIEALGLPVRVTQVRCRSMRLLRLLCMFSHRRFVHTTLCMPYT